MKKIEKFFNFLRVKFNNLFFKLFIIKKMKKKKYYTSLCTIFKNEAKYLKEWLDYHLIIGVEHFYIYNNFSTDNYQDVLKPYIDAEIVTLIEWPYKHAQTEAYTDCVKRFSFESNWIRFIDADEFAVPIKHNNIKDWLCKFEKFPCVIGFYRNYGSSGVIEELEKEYVIEQFTMCTDFMAYSMFFNTRWHKIAKPFTITHYCRFKFFNKVCPSNSLFFTGLSKKIKNPEFQFNHYYCKSYNYFLNKKMTNGDAYSNKIKTNLDNFYRIENLSIYEDKKIYKYLSRLKTFNLNEYIENHLEE